MTARALPDRRRPIGARLRSAILPIFTGLVVAYLFLPILVMAVFGFNDIQGRFNFTWQGFTLDHWANLFGRYPALNQSLINSLIVAMVSTAVATTLGTLIAIVIAANVRIDPDRRWEDLEPRIRTALYEAFDFESRRLGQDVFLSEVQATIQRVEGVLSVDVDTLDRVRIDPVTLDADPLGLPASGRLVVETARLESDGSRILPAQVALLRPDVPDTLILTEVTS